MAAVYHRQATGRHDHVTMRVTIDLADVVHAHGP